MLEVVADRGLEALSVREVATATGVSIGTVQHYFPTKDAMFAAAFDEVVGRVRVRVAGVRLGANIRGNLAVVLRELLPLDDQRAAEARIQLAFSARAAVSADLAAIQRDLLDGMIDELGGAFKAAGQSPTAARISARLALAATDGIAQHAVSTGDLSGRQQTATLDRLLHLLC